MALGSLCGGRRMRPLLAAAAASVAAAGGVYSLPPSAAGPSVSLRASAAAAATSAARSRSSSSLAASQSLFSVPEAKKEAEAEVKSEADELAAEKPKPTVVVKSWYALVDRVRAYPNQSTVAGIVGFLGALSFLDPVIFFEVATLGCVALLAGVAFAAEATAAWGGSGAMKPWMAPLLGFEGAVLTAAAGHAGGDGLRTLTGAALGALAADMATGVANISGGDILPMVYGVTILLFAFVGRFAGRHAFGTLVGPVVGGILIASSVLFFLQKYVKHEPMIWVDAVGALVYGGCGAKERYGSLTIGVFFVTYAFASLHGRHRKLVADVAVDDAPQSPREKRPREKRASRDGATPERRPKSGDNDLQSPLLDSASPQRDSKHSRDGQTTGPSASPESQKSQATGASASKESAGTAGISLPSAEGINEMKKNLKESFRSMMPKQKEPTPPPPPPPGASKPRRKKESHTTAH